MKQPGEEVRQSGDSRVTRGQVWVTRGLWHQEVRRSQQNILSLQDGAGGSVILPGLQPAGGHREEMGTFISQAISHHPAGSPLSECPMLAGH